MQEETFPDLSCPECLSTTSDYLRVLVSWQACPTHRSWQARPHRCALGFRPSCGYLLPPETTPERKKYHNFIKNRPLLISWCASTSFQVFLFIGSVTLENIAWSFWYALICINWMALPRCHVLLN